MSRSDAPLRPVLPPTETFPVGAVVLVVDAAGVILRANRGAAELGLGDAATVRGHPLSRLFQWDVFSQDPGFLAAQWEVLQSSACARPVQLEALLPDGRTRAVTLSLETWDDETARFLAIVTPVTALPAAGSTPVPVDEGWSLLTQATGGLATFDLQVPARQAVYSAGWLHLLGYGPDSLPADYATWSRLLHPDDSGAAPDRVTRKAHGGETRSYAAEFRMRHRRGHWIWLHAVGVQQFDAAGQLARVTGVMLDISERKEVEEQGLVAEERLHRLATQGELALFDADFASGEANFAPAWDRLIGPSSAAPLDRLAQAVGLADAAALAAALREAPEPAWFVRETSGSGRRGERRSAVWAGHRQYSRRGDISRVVGFLLEIPPPEGLARDALLAALDGVHEGVILTDAHATVLHLNAKAARLTGHRRGSERTLKLSHLFKLVNLSDGRAADDAVEAALASAPRQEFHTEHALVGTNGSGPRAIVWAATPLPDPSTGQPGALIVFRDPKEISLSPDEIVRANRFESLAQLAGGIAHDFNNLLTTILGGVSQAKDSRDPTRLEAAEAACLTAKALTRQLLAFAKGSPGGRLQVLNPADLLRDAARVAAAGAVATLHYNVAADTGSIEADRAQLLQVFQNLIINALQALPDQARGALWLSCRNVELAAEQCPPLPPGPYVELGVRDNGCGMPPDVLSRIFEPFFTTKPTGTGLGLATVLSIVRRQGGQLTVNSTPGVGTTFHVYLPVSQTRLEHEVRQAPTLRYGTGRVLLMDDDPKIAELTAAMLTSLEYTHDVARHGEEAIALYRRHLNVGRPYDAVLLDLTIIGGMGGEECFQRLRELDPDVRAIVSSGYDDDAMAQHYLAQGFAAYLTKPYRVTDLSRVLKTALGR